MSDCLLLAIEIPEELEESHKPEVAFEACSYFVNDVECDNGMVYFYCKVFNIGHFDKKEFYL